jgi:tetratricopeptide (TPR) repeat protein
MAQEPPAQFADIANHAAAARDRQNIPEAIDLYSQAVRLKPDWEEGWFYLGLLRYGSNSFPAAIDAFNHLLALKPGVAPALALRGLCEFETAAYDDALRDLEQGVANGALNEPHNEQIIRYHYAELLTRAGRFQDALTQYQFFATQHLDNPDLLLGLGLAGMGVPQLPSEAPSGKKEVLTAVGRAGYLFLSGDSNGADTLFSQLIGQYPMVPNLYFFYGTLLFRHGADHATDTLRREVAAAPQNVSAHALLAYGLMITGHFREAEPEAQIALAASPGMEMAQFTLGHCLAEVGDPKRAAELLNAVLAKDPKNLEAHLGLAALYSRTGQREEAYRERKLCLELEK